LQTRVEQLDDRHRVAIESVDEVQRDKVRAQRGLYRGPVRPRWHDRDGVRVLDVPGGPTFVPEDRHRLTGQMLLSIGAFLVLSAVVLALLAIAVASGAQNIASLWLVILLLATLGSASSIAGLRRLKRATEPQRRGLYLFDDTLVVRHDDGCAAIDRVRIESFEPEEPINRSDEPRTLMVVDGHPIVVLPFDVTGLLEEWRQRA
ncbi:MAG: hypothetical protein RIF41_10885, partial [Polyangiaceae bacterium]